MNQPLSRSIPSTNSQFIRIQYGISERHDRKGLLGVKGRLAALRTMSF